MICYGNKFLDRIHLIYPLEGKGILDMNIMPL